MKKPAALLSILLFGSALLTAGTALSDPDTSAPPATELSDSDHGIAGWRECKMECGKLDLSSSCDATADALCAGRCSAGGRADFGTRVLCTSQCKVLAVSDCVASAVAECALSCAIHADPQCTAPGACLCALPDSDSTQ